MDGADHIFEMSRDMICIASLDGRLTAVNPMFERALGYPGDELVGRPFVDFVHPDDRQATLEVFGALSDGIVMTQFENRLIARDGSKRWLEWDCRAAAGQGAVYAIARDITQSRHAAKEQAELRRVATLVARDPPGERVVSAIVDAVEEIFETSDICVMRFDDDDCSVVAGSGRFGELLSTSNRRPPRNVEADIRVFRTAGPVGIDDPEKTSDLLAGISAWTGTGSVAAAPIALADRMWGVLIIAGFDRLPAETEAALGQVVELMAIAIGNTEAHVRAERLASEQEALRRVATLVAHGASATAVFDAVAAEMERLLGADGATLSRYEPDDELTFLAHRGMGAKMAPPGTRISHAGENVASAVRRTQEAARMEDYIDQPGAIARLVRDIGFRATVGAPIIVDGRLWGVSVSQWRRVLPPADTERRMVQFAELLGAAIANADSRDQLTASRARLLTEADEARRHVVRDLHDGAQRRLVHTIVSLKLAQSAFGQDDGAVERLVGQALHHAERSIAELRELAHGILPAVLTHGGLRAGIDALVERLDLPVAIDLPSVRFAAEIEASAYFVVAEALTNVVKHSRASHAQVTASVVADVLRVDVRDDGVGGADPSGHGLVGLADRVSALGGRLVVDSSERRGTRVHAEFPLVAAATGASQHSIAHSEARSP